jgi:hypothetical protein
MGDPQPGLVSLAGTVYWKESKDRVVGAVIEARARDKSGVTVLTRSDDDGDFKVAGLQPGEWDLLVYHERGFARKIEAVNIRRDLADWRVDLDRKAGTADQRAGIIFFSALVAALLLLLAGYTFLHSRFPATGEQASAALTLLAERALAQAGDQGELQADTRLAATLGEMSAIWQALDQNTLSGLSASDAAYITGLLENPAAALQDASTEQALAQIGTLQELLTALVNPLYFWNTVPLRYVEVVFWALIGVLVNLILVSAGYLRWRRFYVEGIILHLSQLVTVPVLALVFVLLISLVNLTLSISDTTVQLDLEDPRILVAVAFIIGSRPWALWEFIQERAGVLTGRGAADAEN